MRVKREISEGEEYKCRLEQNRERKERNGTGWSKIEQTSKSETGFSFPAHMN